MVHTRGMNGNELAGRGGILAAVVPGQPVAVLEAAARLADDLDVPLVCANVDPDRYLVSSYVDGTVVALPYDPDLPEAEDHVFDVRVFRLGSEMPLVCNAGSLRIGAAAGHKGG